MSDLTYTVKAEGVKDVEALARSLESLHKVLDSGKGSGKALEEVRKLIVGFKGQASVFEEMRNSMQSMQQTMADMSSKMPAVVRMMTRGIAQEMKVVIASMRTDGAAAGKAFTDGMSQNLDVATTVIQRQGKSIAAAARAESTKIYEAMVAGQPNAKITTKGMEALFKLQEAGATLSPYHKGILENWKKSSAETYRALQSQIATEAKELAELAKIGQQKVVAQVKAATIETSAPYSSVGTGRTYNMAQYMLDQIYPPKALFEAEAAKRLAEFKALQDRAARQYAAAANMPSGAYTKFNPSTGAKGATVGLQEPVIPKDKPGDVLNLASAFDKLALSGNDVHSMARGLASGFNLLWLTWGNLVPLFIGAGISNGFMQTAKTGMEVAHTMKTIAVLGGNTAQEMASLSNELDRLGKSGPFGPKEIAESMKTLSLAGLKANEILAVTKDVLNFSVAGTTDLKTAADALVSISTAFGMGAQGFGRVADVVSKAAAESKSSVESFANAMKTASVINKQYGVSLEDTATGIAALSQLGIEGTAAGTALRNMYADLSGRSMQVAKVLKSQGIEMRTATGEFRPMLEVVAELNDKLLKLDGISQKNLLQAILSERGAKGMVELLQLIQQEAKNMGSGLSNSLAELKRNITESYGFAAISAAQLAQSTQESFKAVKATLSTSMNEAYQAMEPTLYLLADSLKKAFASPEFVSGLTTMVSFVANLARSFIELTKFVVEHAEAIALVSAAYVGVTMLIRNKAAATAAATAATTADTAATVANNAAKAGAVGALGTMARFLPGIGTAVSIAAVAWSAYDLWQGRSKDTAVEASNLYNSNIVKNLNDEASRLERLNALRREGLGLSEAQAVLDSQDKVKASGQDYSRNYQQAAAKEAAAWAEYRRLEASGRTMFQDPKGFGYKSLDYFKGVAEEASNAAKAAFQLETQSRVAANTAAARVAAARREEFDRMVAEAKERADKLAKSFGTGVFNLTDKNGKGGSSGMPSVRQELYTEQKALTEITKARDAELANKKRNYDLQKQLLDNKNKNELISRTEYAIQVAAQTDAFEEHQLKSLTDYNQKYQAQSLKAIAELQRNEELYREAGNKDRADNFASLAETQREAAVRVAKDTAEKVTNIQQEAATRNQIIIQDMAGEASKLLKADDKIWKERTDKLNAAKDLEAINDQYKFLNTSVFSAAEGEKAYAMAMVETMSSVKAQNKTLEEFANHLQAVADAQYAIIMTKDYAGQEDGMSQADADRLAKLLTAREAVQKLRQRIASNTEQGFIQGAEEGALAMNKVMQEKKDAFVGGVSDAIETAIFDGGAEGGKKMRKFLEDELLRKPFRAFVQTSVSFLMNGALGALFGGGGGGGVAAAAGGGGALSALGGIGSAISAGTSALGIGASYGATSLFANGLGATLSAGSSMIGAGSVMSGLGTIAGALGPIALGVGALVSIAKATKGETRTGGQFGIAYDGAVVNQRRGETYTYQGQQFDRDFSNGVQKALVNGKAYRLEGDPAAQESAIRTAVSNTAETINALLTKYGSAASLRGFSAGLETSGKDRGGVFAGGFLSTGAAFGESGKGDNYAGTLYEKFSTNSPDFKAALENFTLDLQQATLQALQAATDLPEYVMRVIRGVDVEALGAEDVAKLLTTVGDLPNKLLESFGLARDTLVQQFTEELAKGDAKAAGDAVAKSLVAGIEQSLYTSATGQIFDIINGGIVAPMLDAIATGASVSEALSQASIDQTIERAKKQAEALAAIFGNAEFTAALEKIRTTVGSILGDLGSTFNYVPQFQLPAVQDIAEASKSAADAAEEARRQWQEITGSLLSEQSKLNVELLRAMGKEEEALAAERELAIKGYDAYQIGLYDSNAGLRKQIDLLKEQAASLENVNSLIPQVLEAYLSPANFDRYQYENVAQQLINAGLSGASLTDVVNMLQTATKDQIAEVTAMLWQNGNLTIKQKEVLLESVNTLATLKSAAEDTAKAVKEAFKSAGNSIIEYIRELATGRAGLATPLEVLAKTRQTYQADLAGAKAGDAEAAGRLVSSAKAYIEAQKVATASSDITDTVIQSVYNQLKGLSFVQEILSQPNSPFVPGYGSSSGSGGGLTYGSGSYTAASRMDPMGGWQSSTSAMVVPMTEVSQHSAKISEQSEETNALLTKLIVEIQGLRQQQTAETGTVVAATLNNADAVVAGVTTALVTSGWKSESKPTIK